MKKPKLPKALDAITDAVLAYKPKDEPKKNKRKRGRKRAARH